LTERHPEVHSATIGIWIQAGSIYEQENEHGLAHLLEHMVFKGTRRRSMMQIAKLMDSIGGQMNAFTDREFVCYHAKVLSEHTPKRWNCCATSQPSRCWKRPISKSRRASSSKRFARPKMCRKNWSRIIRRNHLAALALGSFDCGQ
jgi:hypothetical protein